MKKLRKRVTKITLLCTTITSTTNSIASFANAEIVRNSIEKDYNVYSNENNKIDENFGWESESDLEKDKSVVINEIMFTLTDNTNNNVFINKAENILNSTVVLPKVIKCKNKVYNVVSINDYAFAECNKLESIIIPNTIDKIGKYAFYNCRNLMSVGNFSNATRIESGAFLNCGRLKSINISDNVSFIDETAFNGCNNLSGIFVNEENKNYMSINGVLFSKDMTKLIRCPEGKAEDEYDIPDGVISIEDGAFSTCNNIKRIMIPESVKFIEEDAFYDCLALENIIIPSKVKKLKNNAFNGCSNLKFIEIKGELTSIGTDVFHGCNNLKTIKMKNSINNKENHIFYGESKLKSIEANDGTRLFIEYNGIMNFDNAVSLIKNSGIGNTASIISDENSILSNVSIDNNSVTTGTSVVVEAKKSVTTGAALFMVDNTTDWKTDDDFVNNRVTIKGIQFYLTDIENKCVSVDRVVGEIDSNLILPSEIECKGKVYAVTGMNEFSLQSANNLVSIVIPGSIKDIGAYALSYCDNLEEVEIQEGVKSIEFSGLFNCPNLQRIKIPSTLSSVEENVLRFCNKLEEINVAADNENYESINGVLFNKGATKLIKYPGAKADSNYTVPNSVKTIDQNSFTSATNLQSIGLVNGITSIGYGAFSGCSGLMSIEIPGSVTTIGTNAFEKCDNLKTINTNSSNSDYESIDGVLFNKGATKLIKYPKGKIDTSYTVPNGVQTIEQGSFTSNGHLQSIQLANGITSIGSFAFSGCSGLMSMEIPSSVTSIGYGAFRDCNGILEYKVHSNDAKTMLINSYSGIDPSRIVIDGVDNITDWKTDDNFRYNNVTIKGINFYLTDSANKYVIVNYASGAIDANLILPSQIVCNHEIYKVVGINPWAFSGNSNLQSVQVANGITSIGYGAFSGCSGLMSVEISSSVEIIGDNAFDGCSQLQTINVAADNENYESINGVLFNKGATKLIKYPGAKADSNYTVPNSVKTIDQNSFTSAANLQSIGLVNGITSIGYGAFSGCSGLMSIEIPGSVTTIGTNAFEKCDNLKTINTNSSNSDYESIDGVLFNKGATQLIKYPKGKIDTSYTVPNGVQTIEQGSFTSNGHLQSIQLANGITSIGSFAFGGCSGLMSMEIPSSVTSIGYGAFRDCNGILEYKVHSNDAKTMLINSYSGIDPSRIVIDGVDNITDWKTDDNFRYNNVTIKGIEFYLTDSANKYVIVNYAGGAIDSNLILPSQIVCNHEVYKVVGINPYAFYGNSNLQSVQVANGITSIGYGTFSGCSGLMSVEIPSSVEIIGDNAFDGCSQLQTINVAADNENYESINGVLFNKGTTKLIKYPGAKADSNYTVPNSVKTIDQNSFTSATNLQSIGLVNGITSIGYGAFSGCSGLMSIEIPGSVTTIGTNAFEKCDNLKTINTNSGNSDYESIDGVLFNKGATKLIKYPKGKTDTSYTVPNGVQTIGQGSFTSNGHLQSIQLANGITSIGSFAFGGCSGLMSMEIPSSVTSIGYGAFQDCNGISEYKVHSNDSKTMLINSYSGINPSRIVIDGVDNITDWKTDSDFRYNNVTIKGINFYLTDSANKYVNINYVSGAIDSNLILPSQIVCNHEVYKVVGINPYAFYGNSNLQSVQVANGITSIGYGAFSGCSGLMSVEISSSVEIIGDNAFDGCSQLQTINVAADNENYESINGVLFNKGATKLIKYPGAKADSNYTVPNSVKTIDQNSFTSAANLQSIGLVNGITSIGYGAFSGCSGLMSIEIPGSVTTIGDNAFDKCDNLKTINTNSSNSDYESIDGVLFNKGATQLIKYPKGKTDTSYTVPNGVQTIGQGSFTSNGHLQSIQLANGITSIGSFAFGGCSGLMSMEIPSSVTSIGYGAFQDCNGISEYKVHSNDSKTMLINSYSGINPSRIVIDGVDNITDWKTDSDFRYNNVTIKGINFYLTDSANKYVNINYVSGAIDSNLILPSQIVCNHEVYKVVGINPYAFYGNSNLQSVQVANGITSIGYGAFSGCSGLMSVEIPSSVEIIGDNAFDGCSQLQTINVAADNENYESINGVLFNKGATKLIKYPGAKADSNYTVPNSVKTIDQNSFTSAANLQSIGLVNGITSIGYGAFSGCSGLMSIEIPGSVTTIGTNAFEKCDNLKTINTNSSNSDYESIDGVLFNKGATKLIKYSKGKTDTSYTVPNGVQTIGQGSFTSNGHLQSIQLANGITSIGSFAFGGCSGLMSIEIPSSVTNIGYGAFQDCNGISEYKVHSNDAKTMLINSYSGIDPKKIKIYSDVSGTQELGGSKSKGKESISIKQDASNMTTQVYGNDNTSQYVAKAIETINGEIKEKETILTLNGNTVEVITISENNTESAQLIKTETTDIVSIKADTNKKVYVYVEELGAYKKVDSLTVDDKITFNAQGNNIYLLGNENTVGTKVISDGWNKVNESWYVVNSDGSLKTGWYNDNGTWYNMANDGKMNTGWLKDTDGTWYLLADNGVMKTGWYRDSNSKWYFLKGNGAMAHDEFINGYYVGSDGSWLES
ncbi:leucine-rich repeat protein [Clostridium saccharoperbutylacetonicum]